MTLCLTVGALHAADEELARHATWKPPAVDEVKAQLDQWLAAREVAPATRAQVDALWEEANQEHMLDRLADSLALVDQPAGALVALCQGHHTITTGTQFDFLDDEQTAPLVRNNLRLLYGRWLLAQQLYNEALEQLEPLRPEEVVDPASLLFFKSAAYHRLLKKPEGLATIAQLLENEQAVPHRYVTVARLMETDLRPLETDSLDEVSRLMDSIGIRLGHGRAGQRVRKEQDDVVSKLDKLIEQIEQQAQQAQSSGSSGSLRPSQPMQDSNPGGGTGPGNVDPKRLEGKGNWGNLPPKERQEALQQLGKDYPSHYRDVIEEYFRKLAQEEGEP
jgi:hypothetical protein